MTHTDLVREHLRFCVASMRRTKKSIAECTDELLREIYERELRMQKFHFRLTWSCLRHAP
jgi:hypothetical protein